MSSFLKESLAGIFKSEITGRNSVNMLSEWFLIGFYFLCIRNILFASKVSYPYLQIFTLSVYKLMNMHPNQINVFRNNIQKRNIHYWFYILILSPWFIMSDIDDWKYFEFHRFSAFCGLLLLGCICFWSLCILKF